MTYQCSQCGYRVLSVLSRRVVWVKRVDGDDVIDFEIAFSSLKASRLGETRQARRRVGPSLPFSSLKASRLGETLPVAIARPQGPGFQFSQGESFG